MVFVNVQISLEPGESPPTKTPQEFLVELGGDPAKDTISVSISASHTPPPPEAPAA